MTAASGNGSAEESPPWPQRVLDSIWLLAGAAIAFWLLSYVVWGLVDILAVGGG